MKLRIAAALVLPVLLAGPAHAGGAKSEDLEARLAKAIAANEKGLIALRHDLHRNPEVSGSEERTARVIAERLKRAGLRVRTGVGGHGVVATLEGALPGPVVAFRADMDAVTSDAPDPAPFASVKPGVRHICGHDVHTAIGVALAEGLAAVRADLAGTVRFYFQPAEETATGARAMIADGALDAPRPRAIFAVHAAPMAVGEAVTSTGVLMPARDRIRLTLTGERAQARIGQARSLLESAGTLSREASRQPATGDFAYVETLNPRAEGSSWIAEAIVTLSGPRERERVTALLDRGRHALEHEGVRTALVVEPFIAGVTNDPDLAARAMRSAARVLGNDSVRTIRSLIPAFSEDFGSFQAEVPGVMFFLGVSNPEKGIVGMPHTPGFAADDAAIVTGAKAMGAVLLDALRSM